MALVEIKSILTTPLGKIFFLIDGEPHQVKVVKEEKTEFLSDLDGYYHLEIDFVPDGKYHLITCGFLPNQIVTYEPDCGERTECWSYYNKEDSIKLSIAQYGEFETTFPDFETMKYYEKLYDYSGYMEEIKNVFYHHYEILPKTQTSHYSFGVAWTVNCTDENETQTYYGASFALY